MKIGFFFAVMGKRRLEDAWKAGSTRVLWGFVVLSYVCVIGGYVDLGVPIRREQPGPIFGGVKGKDLTQPLSNCFSVIQMLFASPQMRPIGSEIRDESFLHLYSKGGFLGGFFFNAVSGTGYLLQPKRIFSIRKFARGEDNACFVPDTLVQRGVSSVPDVSSF